MNYLAHIALSRNNKEIEIGNFVADHLKGMKVGLFPETIQKGIFLHRKIDSFTDQHPILSEARKLLAVYFHKYSGVILDVYFDHFLSKHWNDFYPNSLRDFTNDFYQSAKDYRHVFPDSAKKFYRFMVQNDVLFRYQNLQDLKKVMEGISRRTYPNSGIEKSTAFLIENFEYFEKSFLEFYPLLITECNDFLNNQEISSKLV